MDQSQKPFSPACERNRHPILEQLQTILQQATHVLEIGSGTGQHAVYFAQHLSHLRWYPSDRIENHPSILAWMAEANLSNIAQPIALDVNDRPHWPTQKFDAAFTANTCHIMAWEEVEIMFEGLEQCLDLDAKLVIYGPFNYAGNFTSASNEAFHHSLRNQGSHMGIRDIEDIKSLANSRHFEHIDDIEMPANNRILVFQKTTNS